MGSVDTDAGALTNAGATLGSQDVYPAAEMPRLPLTAAGVPGKTNVTVLQGKTQTIYPGSYGALTNNGTLRLAAGTYSFSSVTLGDKSITYALPFGNTVLSVAATLRTGTAATLAQVSGIAGAFDIVVMGANPSTSVAAASIGTSNSVVAVLTVPRGTISIGDNSAVTGALGARSIAAGNNVTLKYDSGLPAATVQVTCPDSVSSSMDPQTLSVSGDFGFGPTTLTDLFTLQTNGEVSTTMDTQRLGQELLRQTTSGRRADGTSETSIDYGSAFHGISHAEFIDNGTTISGTIDGRAFVPVPASSGSNPSLAFADGMPAPSVTIDAGTLESIAAVTAAVASATAVCGPTGTVELLSSGSPPPFEPGHFLQKDTLGTCTSCKEGCTGTYAACETATIGGCAGLGIALAPIPILGIFAGAACAAGGTYGCDEAQQGCDDHCETGSDCCPQACGVGCCSNADKCLDQRVGNCSSAGLRSVRRTEPVELLLIRIGPFACRPVSSA